MKSTTVVHLLLLGTALAQQSFTPVLPRWIHADNYGKGYVITNYWNGTYEYKGQLSVSWDFDYNCMRQLTQGYDEYLVEAAYCDNILTEYHYKQGCSKNYIGLHNIEKNIKDELNEFTINWGSGFSDPVWGLDNYQVLEHRTEWLYIYQRPSDRAIEFIVDASQSQYDVVVYFPDGLTLDNNVTGVWDYELRYGKCTNNHSINSFTKVFSSHKTPIGNTRLSKPANLAAKPRAIITNQASGVRSHFMDKVSKNKASSILDKATFTMKMDP